MRLTLLSVFSLTAISLGCSSAPKKVQATAPALSAPTAARAPVPPQGSKTVELKPLGSTKKEIVAPKVVQPQKLVCLNANDTRVMEIEPAQPQGCGLFYERDGKREKVAWSVRATTHCETVQERIKGNLESGGFKCSEATQQAVPAPAPVPADVKEKGEKKAAAR